jgi:hypothetical protein
LGYYAYLPAVFLDHDLTMWRTGLRSFGGDPALIQGVRWTRTTVPLGQPGDHQYLDQYGVGEAVLLSPFFTAGYALAIVTQQPKGGFSWPFQATAATAAIFYMLLGLGLLASVLRHWFSSRTVVITLLALTFGAAVFDYATFEPTMSHIYSFFAVALVLRLTLWVWDRPTLAGAIALGAALGLVGLIRATNLTLVIFCLLVGVERLGDLGKRGRALVRRPGLVAAGVGASLLTLMLQAAYWHRITGAWITNPYRGGDHLDLLDPHLIGVLFSVRKGLFFWTPLLLLAVVGLAFLRRTARPIFLASVVYLSVAVWVVASWSVWWYGDSFGMRALIDEIPVFALGLAALVEVARGAIARAALGVAVGLMTLLAIHGMLAYWLYVLRGDGTTFHRYVQSLEYPFGSRPFPSYTNDSLRFVDLVPSIVGNRTSAPHGGEVDLTVHLDNPTRLTLGDVLLTLQLSPGLELLGPPFYQRGSGCVGTSTLVCHLDFVEARMNTLLRLGVLVTSAPGSKEDVRITVTSDGLASRHSADFKIAVATWDQR